MGAWTDTLWLDADGMTTSNYSFTQTWHLYNLTGFTTKCMEHDSARHTDPYLLQVFGQLHALKMQLLWGQQPGKAAWCCRSRIW